MSDQTVDITKVYFKIFFDDYRRGLLGSHLVAEVVVPWEEGTLL